MKSKFRFLSLLSRLGKDKHASGPRLLARLLRDEEGSYVVYMALVLPILIGTAGLASEGSWWLYLHQTMQNAADAAAVSAAAALSKGKDKGEDNMQITTEVTSQANAITSTYCALPGQSSTCFVNGSNNVTVTVNPSPSATPPSVEVTVAQLQPLLFSKIWLSASKNISARAVAVLNNNNANCVLALGTTGAGIGFTSDNLNFDMTACSMFSNSSDPASISFTGNNNSIGASRIGTVGGVQISGNNSSFPPAPSTTGDPKVTDPYAALAATTPWPASCTSSCTVQTVPPCSAGCTAATLSPGVYPDPINLNQAGVTWTFGRGVYYLQNLVISAPNITVDATAGVTLVLTGGVIQTTTSGTNATIKITAPTSDKITAPTSEWNAGIAIWEPTSTGFNALTGTLNIVGAIYAPQASVSFANSGTTTADPTCTQIVAKSVQFGGNSIKLQGGDSCANVPGSAPLLLNRAAALVE